MVEEFAFILCHLHKDDRDGALVLGHELLLLAHSRCHRKRGSRRAGATPLDRLPTCPFQTLECAMLAPDTIQLECLAWAVFDNIMGPGEAPPLSGFKTYNQIVGCLASKAYKGVHTHCPAHTSTSFGAEVTTSRMGSPDSKKRTRPRHYTMMRDVREEFVGSYSALKEKQDIVGKDQSYAPTCPVDPNTQGMKWMKECQHFLQRCATGILVVIKTPNGRRQGIYPSTSPQTLVCVALVFGCRPSHVPSHTHIHEHRILAARK